MLLRPTRVREKPARFHISTHVPTKNAPGLIFPNRDTPKTYPVLGANPCRRIFRGVCFCALHGCTQNLPDFRPKPSARLFERRMQYAPTRVRAKPARFHISPSGYAKNAPDFTFPNKDSPKTRSILGPNLRRGFFRGVCFCALHGHVQNLAGFIFPHTDTPKTHPILGPNHRHRTFRGVCNTPLHVYAQNPPDFTLPNKDTPKTCPVLDPNLWRGTFGGVCNTPLHGYVQNLTGFIFPHLNTPKTHPISPSPIRIRQKRTRF